MTDDRSSRMKSEAYSTILPAHIQPDAEKWSEVKEVDYSIIANGNA